MDNVILDTEIIDAFKLESLNYISNINELLLIIEKEGIKNESISEIKRKFHTLKSNSRMLGLKEIGKASHIIEDFFELIENGEKKLDSTNISRLLKVIDNIEDAINKFPDENIVITFPDNFLTVKDDNDQKQIEQKINKQSTDQIKLEKDSKIEKTPEFINLKLDKLNFLINLSALFSEYGGRFNYILSQLKDFIEKNSDEKFEELESIINNFSHELTFYKIYTKQLQDKITDLKLIPLSAITKFFPRIVRDIAKENNKEVEIIIKGEDVDLDKIIVDELNKALIHIIQNAVDHGCELPKIRKNLKKSKKAQILFKAYNKGDNVIIEISDDGKGLDIVRIKEKAIKQGLISTKEAGKLDKESIVNLIFEHGFSTSSNVGYYSGRGVGMNVVVDIIKKLHGEIKVKTVKDMGTTFTITVPLISSYISVIVFSVNDKLFGIPSFYIKSVISVKKDQLKISEDGFFKIDYKNMGINLIDLKTLFGITDKINNESVENIMLVQFRDEIAGFVISNIVLENKMILKSLDSLKNKMNILLGVILLENRIPVPVLEVAELFAILKKEKIQLTRIIENEKSNNKMK